MFEVGTVIENKIVAEIRYTDQKTIDRINKNRAACEGQDAVKAIADQLFPCPVMDTIPESVPEKYKKERFEGWVKRMQYPNVAGRTLQSHVGQIFAEDPNTETVPTSIEYLLDDINGDGLDFYGQSLEVADDILCTGSSVLFVDMPPESAFIDEESGKEYVSQAEADSGYYRPTVTSYSRIDVGKVMFRKIGAKRLVSLIPLNEKVCIQDQSNPLKIDEVEQIRILYLDEQNLYSQAIIQKVKDTDSRRRDSDKWVVVSKYDPKLAGGKRLDYIPCFPGGSENNDWDIDKAPMTDLVDINIGLAINNADTEENAAMSSQATLICKTDSKWLQEMDSYNAGKAKNGEAAALKGTGSFAVLNAPTDGGYEYLQAKESNASRTLALDKFESLRMMGASLLWPSSNKTAAEVLSGDEANKSAITRVAMNLSNLMTVVLRTVAMFDGVNEVEADNIEIEFKNGADIRVFEDEVGTLIQAWKDQAITYGEMRLNLERKYELKEEDDIEPQIKEEQLEEELQDSEEVETVEQTENQ